MGAEAVVDLTIRTGATDWRRTTCVQSVTARRSPRVSCGTCSSAYFSGFVADEIIDALTAAIASMIARYQNHRPVRALIPSIPSAASSRRPLSTGPL